MRLFLYSLLLLCAALADPAAAGEPAVPPDLAPWIPWVLHPLDRRACPLDPGAAESGDAPPEGPRICAWPGRLSLDLEARGGTFTQTWQVYAEAWAALPGDPETWPQEVRDGERPLPVVLHGEAPSVRLEAGTHVLSGHFHWPRPPDGLNLPARTGLVSLTLDGVRIPFPHLDHGGRLWLTDPAAAEPQDGDRLRLQVYRRIDDDLPLRVTTRIELDLAGHTRQLQLGPVLLPGTIPLRVQSPLPARLDGDGTLHVQARPGHWVLEVGARIGGAVGALTRPEIATPWPAAEVWSFAARPDLRQVDLSGGLAVDPRQAGVPADWSDLPSYRMTAGETLRLTERRRGDPDPGPDQLTLERDLWPDLGGRAFSVRDRIGGYLRRSWRLTASAPLDLGSVQVDGEPRLITRLTPTDTPGVEVRRGRLELVADSRLKWSGGASLKLPATGWNLDFTGSRALLYLPPGWDLLATTGTDNLPDSWIARWTLLDLFLVLILALGVTRLWGWAWGLVAGLTLVLTWQVPEAPQLVWINLLMATGLARLLPAQPAGIGRERLRAALVWYRRLTLAALLLVGLPFVAGQVRTGFYPHLERPAMGLGTTTDPPLAQSGRGAARPPGPPPGVPQAGPGFAARLAGTPLPDDGAPAAPAAGAGETLTTRVARPAADAAAPAEPPEPDAVVQSGAGIPDWHWNRFELTWSGAVGASEGARLWLTGPRWHLLQALLGALLTVILGLRMAGLGGWPGARPPPDPRPCADGTETAAAAGTPAGPGRPAPSGQQTAWPTLAPTAPPASAVPASEGDAQPEPLALLPWGTPADRPSAVEPVTELGPETRTASSDPRIPPLALTLILGVLTLNVAIAPTYAADLPGADLLSELRARLLAPPDCLPDCVDLPHLTLKAEPQRLRLHLTLDAAVAVAAAIPGSPGGWVPTELRLDGAPLDGLYRDADDRLLVPLPAGRHQLDLAGPLPARPQVEIPFPLRPRRIETSLDCWTLEGLDAGGLPGPQVRLLRRCTEDGSAAPPLTQGTLPPLLRVERTLHIGRDWRAETRIRRLSPAEFPVAVDVPLLAAEAVQTPGLAPADGRVLISLAPGETETGWVSTLDQVPSLRLTALDDPRLTETWTLDLSPRWHLTWSGPAPIRQLAADRWQPTWRPLPGEGLALVLSQPAAVPGRTLTIDRVELWVTLGRRASENALHLQLRSTLGGLHPIRLPAGAEPTSFRTGAGDLPLPRPGAPLEIPLVPGRQSVQIAWRGPQANGVLIRPGLPDLESPAVNLNLTVRVPPERWVLFTGGPRIGPVVLFWGVLLVLAGLALGLGRLRLTPLKAHDWLLLGIGLSLAQVWVLLLVVGWLIALGLRRRLAARTPRWRYNLTQVLLLVLTLAAGAGLIGAVSQGLLGTPGMQIMGNGSGGDLLAWYQDRTAGPLPAVWIISVPIWVYRALMLAWALWLAVHLLDWLHWGWEGCARPVLWRGATG